MLAIRCSGDGDTEIFMASDGYIGGDRILVTYKWNDEELISERWSGSTSGRAAFLPDGYRDFLRGLTNGGRLVFQWSDYNGSRSLGIWENIQLNDDASFVLNGCQ